MNVSQAVEWIRENIEQTEEVKVVLDFIANSDRGLIKLAKSRK